MQMMSNVDGHSWALSAIEDERPSRVSTPLNRELIPLTDSPVVVQQHNIPQQKFVLLSAKVNFKERFTSPGLSRYLFGALRAVYGPTFTQHADHADALTGLAAVSP